MNTLFIFIGLMALVGTVGYLTLRPVVLNHWDRWQGERALARERQHRTQRQQFLREQATASALQQLAQREAATRDVGRKAA